MQQVHGAKQERTLRPYWPLTVKSWVSGGGRSQKLQAFGACVALGFQAADPPDGAAAMSCPVVKP